MSYKTCMNCVAGEANSYDYPCIDCSDSHSKWKPKPAAIQAQEAPMDYKVTLLPCPFCGAPARLIQDDLCGDGPGYWRVWCNGKENHGLDALFDDAQGAIDTWNRRQAQEASKAAGQSAEELAKKIVATIDFQTRPLYCDGEWRSLITKNLIEADRAAQRQAGREEMRAILTEAMEAMDERRCYLDNWEWKYGERWDKEDAAIRKALSDLDEARKG